MTILFEQWSIGLFEQWSILNGFVESFVISYDDCAPKKPDATLRCQIFSRFINCTFVLFNAWENRSHWETADRKTGDRRSTRVILYLDTVRRNPNHSGASFSFLKTICGWRSRHDDAHASFCSWKGTNLPSNECLLSSRPENYVRKQSARDSGLVIRQFVWSLRYRHPLLG